MGDCIGTTIGIRSPFPTKHQGVFFRIPRLPKEIAVEGVVLNGSWDLASKVTSRLYQDNPT